MIIKKKIFSDSKRHSYYWDVEKNKSIFILDGEGSSNLIPSFNGRSFFINNRNTTYIRILIESIFIHLPLSLSSLRYFYHMRMITKVNPKLIISLTDNSFFYSKIDQKISNQIPFLTIQNGTHYVGDIEEAGEGFKHGLLNKKTFYSNLACISQHEVDYYSDKGLQVEKYHKLGSLKISGYTKDFVVKPKKFDLCIVGNSVNNRPANIIVWKLILEYINSYDVSICIVLKSKIAFKNQPLFDYFKNTSAVFVANTPISSHYHSDISKVTIGFASTLLRQTFSRGNKIYPLNFGPGLMDTPFELLGHELRPSYSEFESYLSHLLALSDKEYIHQYKGLMKYLDTFNPKFPPALKLEALITELIMTKLFSKNIGIKHSD